LLWPFVTEVQFGTDPINIDTSVLEAEEVDITVLASNGQTITDLGAINDLLEFSVADDTIAQVVPIDGSKILVRGLIAGTTTVQVTRKEGTIAPRRPAAPSLIFTPPQVVVVV
jgi:Flp pilus assembly secretin CpaC